MVDILKYIPVGSENGKTGRELASELDMDERLIRELISKARRNTVILNMQNGKGYFQPAEDEGTLIADWLGQEESRLKKHALALRAARKIQKGLRHGS